MNPDVVELQRFISIREVERLVGLSKSSIWRRIDLGTFPSPAYRERSKPDPKTGKDQWSVTRWTLQSVLDWRQSKLGAAKAQAPEPAQAAA
jgi:CP4-57 regulatory protein AlpA